MTTTGPVEVKLGEGRITKFRRAANKMDLASLASILGEAVYANTSYKLLRERFEKQRDGEDSKKSVEAFAALVDLETSFMQRAGPTLNRILADLTKRAEGGVPPSDYALTEVVDAATAYLKAHAPTEEERKNADGGPPSA